MLFLTLTVLTFSVKYLCFLDQSNGKALTLLREQSASLSDARRLLDGNVTDELAQLRSAMATIDIHMRTGF